MQLRDVMNNDVRLTDPETPLKVAATMMRDGDFGLLPVGENDRLVGTISDRDITVRAVAVGKDPNTTKVREVMSEGIHYGFDDQPVAQAADLMRREQIRRLPVLNRDKRLVGIVAMADIATEPETIRPAAQAIAGVSR